MRLGEAFLEHRQVWEGIDIGTDIRTFFDSSSNSNHYFLQGHKVDGTARIQSIIYLEWTYQADGRPPTFR